MTPKEEPKGGKQKSAVNYSPGDVIQIFGPCKLVHVGGSGGRFSAFRDRTTPKPRVKKAKRTIAKSKPEK